MHTNNELGTILPIKRLSAAAKRKNPKILFHTDAAQSVGKIPVDVDALGVDMLSIAAHKFYGPKGIGALYIKKSAQACVENIFFGAGHECGMRPGTENTPLIAGLGQACELARAELSARVKQMEKLSGVLLQLLRKKLPGLELNAGGAPRLPNTLSVRIRGADAQRIIESLADKLALSAGAACHAGGKEKTPSAVLKAVGLSDREVFSSLRISLGKFNTEEEVKEGAALLQRAFLQQGPGR
jgi:cysteine desulfurase